MTCVGIRHSWNVQCTHGMYRYCMVDLNLSALGRSMLRVSPWTTRSHVGLMSVLAPPWWSHVAKIQRGEAVSCRSHVILHVNLEKISPAALLTRGDTPRTPRATRVVSCHRNDEIVTLIIRRRIFASDDGTGMVMYLTRCASPMYQVNIVHHLKMYRTGKWSRKLMCGIIR